MISDFGLSALYTSNPHKDEGDQDSNMMSTRVDLLHSELNIDAFNSALYRSLVYLMRSFQKILSNMRDTELRLTRGSEG